MIRLSGDLQGRPRTSKISLGWARQSPESEPLACSAISLSAGCQESDVSSSVRRTVEKETTAAQMQKVGYWGLLMADCTSYFVGSSVTIQGSCEARRASGS